MSWVEKLLERLFGKKAQNWPPAKVSGPKSVVSTAEGNSRIKAIFFFKEDATAEITNHRPVFYKKCGHTGPRGADFNIYGNDSRFLGDISFLKREIDTQCPECWLYFFKKHSIRCAFCGYGIIPGDPVALYDKDSPGIRQEAATFMGESVIGCLLWSCCPTGGLFAGRWTEEGFKPLFGRGAACQEALDSGRPIYMDIK